MKKKHLLATTKLCLMAFASSALIFTSCARDGFDEETFESNVWNTQVETPSADKITIKQNSSGTEQIISWPVVLGAGGFECKVVDESDAANPEVIFEEVVDGCSFRAKREDDAKYRIYIHALGNKKNNNTDATNTTEIAYSTIIEPYKVIESGTDLATFFKSEQIPANTIDEATKEIQAVAYQLEPGGSYTVSDTVYFGNRKILLYSTKAGADIKLTGENASFNIQNGFTLRNVRIDCGAATVSGLIVFADKVEEGVPFNESVYPEAGTKGSYIITEPVGFRNCMVSNLNKALFSTGKSNGWAIVSLVITNNIIQMNNDKSSFLAFDNSGKHSAFKELLMTDNTIYNIATNADKFPIRFVHNSSATKLFAKENSQNTPANTFVWKITNNTIMRVFTKKGFGNNLPNLAAVTNIMTDNIFIDCYQLEKYCQGQQTITTYNNYLYGIETNVATADKKFGTVMDPGFVPPTTPLDLTQKNGGLDLTPAGEVFTASAGDPRWLK